MGFELQYLGGGLSAALPPGATPTTNAGTADPGPLNASVMFGFEVDGSAVVIGRRVGVDAQPEAPEADDVSQRAETGLVIIVKAADAGLRTCLLESVDYDEALDRNE